MKPKKEKTHYTSSELKEFKILIEGKLKKAIDELKEYKSLLANDNNGTDDTSQSFNIMDDSSKFTSKEEANIHVARQEKFIQNLKKALERIENGNYGICKITGKLIPKDRLKAVPHATMGVDAKAIANNPTIKTDKNSDDQNRNSLYNF